MNCSLIRRILRILPRVTISYLRTLRNELAESDCIPTMKSSHKQIHILRTSRNLIFWKGYKNCRTKCRVKRWLYWKIKLLFIEKPLFDLKSHALIDPPSYKPLDIKITGELTNFTIFLFAYSIKEFFNCISSVTDFNKKRARVTSGKKFHNPQVCSHKFIGNAKILIK